MEYYYLNENSNEVLVENRSGPISSVLVVLVTIVVSSDDFHYCFIINYINLDFIYFDIQHGCRVQCSKLFISAEYQK